MRKNLLQHIPLRALLIVPFLAQITLAVGLTSYLSLRNGQNSVNQLAQKLKGETSQRINQHLNEYTNTARRLTAINSEQITLGHLNPNNPDQLAHFFARQVKQYDVGYLLYGNLKGEFIAAGYYYDAKIPKGGNPEISLVLPDRYQNRDVHNYRTNADSKIIGSPDIGKDYQFQKEGWYAKGVTTKKPGWSDIYQWEVGEYPLSIATSQPLFDRAGRLIGAIGVEQRLSQISEFLRQIQISSSSRIFILERSGFLVASSSESPVFSVTNNQPKRLKGNQINDPLIQASSQFLENRFQNINNIREPQQLDFIYQQQRQYLQITPWKDEWGLDWLVVITVPESDFMAQINANTRNTIFLCIAALALAIVLGIYTSRWITRPIRALQQASEAIADGNFDNTAALNSNINEIQALARSFSQMDNQLKQSFATLKQQAQELSEKNTQLKTAMTELHQTQAQIVQSEKMSALGNLVAGIAHEVNNPLGFLKGSIKNAQDYVQDLLHHIALYQQHSSKPVAAIQKNAEQIDLEFIYEDLPKLLESMNSASNRITAISKSLRIFSRSDTEHTIPADIHEGIDSTLLMLKYRLKSNEHRPDIKIVRNYADLPNIECFPGQLNQVFMNLLGNAIDALEESNRDRSLAELKQHPNQITIATSLTEDGQSVRICIKDNGIGMTDEIKQRIFDHLFTTKAVGKGTGLGLAIARQVIVDKHHGTIDCISAPRTGTEFVIEVPISASPMI